MRNRFDRQLDDLHKQLIEMGAMCESAIANAVKMLLNEDAGLRNEVVRIVEDISKKERDIEMTCMKLLMQQQPVAKDLRQISSALKMITDMERIGIQAADISDIAQLGNVKSNDETGTIKAMSMACIKMVTDSVEAYVKQDVDIARQVVQADDFIDDMFNKTKSELALTMNHQPEKAESAIDMLLIAKYLERIADHAVNIALWVIFAATGRHEGENGHGVSG